MHLAQQCCAHLCVQVLPVRLLPHAPATAVQHLKQVNLQQQQQQHRQQQGRTGIELQMLTAGLTERLQQLQHLARQAPQPT
jgi:hypothetical protein